MNYQLPPSPPLSPIDDDDHSSSISFIHNDNDDDECTSTLSSIKPSCLSSSVSSTSSTSSSFIYNNNNKKKLNRLSQRTVLDDTLDFLDQYTHQLNNNQDTYSTCNNKNNNNNEEQAEDDGFDEQFFQDMAFLLDHPEICNRPLADVTPLLKQHHLEQSHSCNSLSLMNQQHHHNLEKHYQQQQPQSKLQSIYQWGRFLSVLSAAYVVSFLKGPDDLD